MNRLFFIVSLFLSLGASDVFACRCVNLSPCEFYNRSSAIFLGQNITRDEQGNITFRIIEAFKGVEGKSIQVELRGTMCGAVAMPKEVVLVYAEKDEKGRLVARNCGFVREAGRNEGDLEYLRKRNKFEDARLFGGVYDSSISNLILRRRATKEIYEQIRIRVSDGVSEQLLKLDSDNEFKIKDLESGKYKVELLLPDNCVADSASLKEVDLGKRDCRQINFYFSLREETKPKNSEGPKNKPPK